MARIIAKKLTFPVTWLAPRSLDWLIVFRWNITKNFQKNSTKCTLKFLLVYLLLYQLELYRFCIIATFHWTADLVFVSSFSISSFISWAYNPLRYLVQFAQFKNMKNYHGGVFLLVKLQAKAWNFTKSITPPWVLFKFLKLYKWYIIVQSVSYVSLSNLVHSINLSRLFAIDPRRHRTYIERT